MNNFYIMQIDILPYHSLKKAKSDHFIFFKAFVFLEI